MVKLLYCVSIRYILGFIGCLWFIEFDLRTEKIVKELKKSTKI